LAPEGNEQLKEELVEKSKKLTEGVTVDLPEQTW
jgi:hypothetical protein